ncbi:uncharacterized protein LOC134694732 [Mytilus trossulus]|uniref:uncharacterized protein LOC134694732 n=1 Tax=Mytilus trossulus TaxID=6551 RepID=UPI0030044AC9
MGICMSKVGSLSRDNLTLTSLPDRKETYTNFLIYLSESYTYADEIQSDFATNVIQSDRVVALIRRLVEEELKKSKKATVMTDKEVSEIVNQPKKERDWLKKRSKETIKHVLRKLTKVRKDESSFIEKHPNYDTLISKLQPDFMNMLEYRISQIKNQPNGNAESSGDGEIEGPSDHEKSCNDFSQFLKLVSENGSHYGVEIGDLTDRYKKQMHNYALLYECSLLLKTEMEDFSNIYSCIQKGTICK